MGAADLAVDVLGDGRLRKEVLADGAGEPPTADSSVRVHYECRVEGSGEVIDSSYLRGEPLAFTLGRGEALEGLEHGVRSMRQGEKARLLMHPDLALGAAGWGCGEAAAVPGGATLCCDAELVEVSEKAEDADEELSPEEKLQRAMRAKDAGNSFFKSGEHERAAQFYEVALRFLDCEVEGPAGGAADEQMPQDALSWADEARGEARRKLAVASYLNLAQCELRLERFFPAIFHATATLQLEPDNSKALYRRGLAAMKAGLLDRARRDLLEAAKREPRNAEIRAQLQECQAKCRATEQKDRSTFGGMFGKVSLYEEKSQKGFQGVSEEWMADD